MAKKAVEQARVVEVVEERGRYIVWARSACHRPDTMIRRSACPWLMVTEKWGMCGGLKGSLTKARFDVEIVVWKFEMDKR